MALPMLPAELLENILKNLDTRTLLLSQLVSHQWHQLIRFSPTLQARLFIAYAPGPTDDEQYAWFESENRLERLQSGSHETVLANNARKFKRITLNPLLNEEILPLEWNGILPAGQQYGQRHEAIAIERLLASPKGSWRSMFISQPPVKSIVARSIFCSPPNPSRRSYVGDWHGFSVQDENGIKMAQVVEEVLRKAGSLGVLQGDLNAERLNHWHFTCVDCVEVRDGRET